MDLNYHNERQGRVDYSLDRDSQVPVLMESFTTAILTSGSRGIAEQELFRHVIVPFMKSGGDQGMISAISDCVNLIVPYKTGKVAPYKLHRNNINVGSDRVTTSVEDILMVHQIITSYSYQTIRAASLTDIVMILKLGSFSAANLFNLLNEVWMYLPSSLAHYAKYFYTNVRTYDMVSLPLRFHYIIKGGKHELLTYDKGGMIAWADGGVRFGFSAIMGFLSLALRPRLFLAQGKIQYNRGSVIAYPNLNPAYYTLWNMYPLDNLINWPAVLSPPGYSYSVNPLIDTDTTFGSFICHILAGYELKPKTMATMSVPRDQALAFGYALFYAITATYLPDSVGDYSMGFRGVGLRTSVQGNIYYYPLIAYNQSINFSDKLAKFVTYDTIMQVFNDRCSVISKSGSAIHSLDFERHWSRRDQY